MTILWLFLLLALANGTPVIAHRLLRQRWNAPVDGGRLWRDGRPILGKSKTWRGLVVGITSCALLSLVTGFGALFGALFGTLALLGDLVSSFIKRRCGLAQSARAVCCCLAIPGVAGGACSGGGVCGCQHGYFTAAVPAGHSQAAPLASHQTPH